MHASWDKTSDEMPYLRRRYERAKLIQRVLLTTRASLHDIDMTALLQYEYN